MDNTGIKEINNQAVAKLFIETFSELGFSALPKDFNIHDIQSLLGQKRYYSASYCTNLLNCFIEYTNSNKNQKAQLFIDKNSMKATAIFDLFVGDHLDIPGKAEHKATFEADPSPEYSTILSLCNRTFSQTTLAEFGEEWGDTFTFIDSSDQEIELIKAINAIRTMTIKTSGSSESTVGDMSASRSRTAHIEANGRDVTVAGFVSKDGIPIFQGLDTREVKVKLSILTSGDDISLKARILGKEKLLESLANELTEKITSDVDITSYIGTLNV